MIPSFDILQPYESTLLTQIQQHMHQMWNTHAYPHHTHSLHITKSFNKSNGMSLNTTTTGLSHFRTLSTISRRLFHLFRIRSVRIVPFHLATLFKCIHWYLPAHFCFQYDKYEGEVERKSADVRLHIYWCICSCISIKPYPTICIVHKLNFILAQQQ